MNKLLLCLVCILFLSPNLFAQCPEGTITSEENLITNGDFNNTTTSFLTEYKRSKYAGAGNYTIVKDASLFSQEWFEGVGQGYFMAVDGAQGPNKTVWQQTISVKKNTSYFFSAWVSTLMNVQYGPPAVLQFSINNKLLDKPFNCPDKLNTWQQFFVNWNSGDQEKISIKIVSQNPDYNGNDFGLDRLKFYECMSSNLELKLKNAKVGEVIELRNIYFETGSCDLKSTSNIQMDELFDYLSANSKVRIEISGHTDNTGSKTNNQSLSENRANSVAEYLIHKKIDPVRIQIVGYGEDQPIDSNETLEGRQKNRRVEFKILAM